MTEIEEMEEDIDLALYELKTMRNFLHGYTLMQIHADVVIKRIEKRFYQRKADRI